MANEQASEATASVFLMLYLLYKANILTRNHLKHILKLIKEESPQDMAKYLIEEVAKSY